MITTLCDNKEEAKAEIKEMAIQLNSLQNKYFFRAGSSFDMDVNKGGAFDLLHKAHLEFNKLLTQLENEKV
jgi:hypothetical protein